MHSLNCEAINHDLGVGTVPIPVTILTGFLGAGKTTLLNRILNGDHGLRVAVLVNDFGSINIDADLVVGVENDGKVISLANGCVCCNIRDDLLAAVHEVIARSERPEYIVLEASGVAEPSGIAITFMNEGLRDCIRLDSIMCVVDAAQVFAAPEMMELKLRQIAFADMLILKPRANSPQASTAAKASSSPLTNLSAASSCKSSASAWKSRWKTDGAAARRGPRSLPSAHTAPWTTRNCESSSTVVLLNLCKPLPLQDLTAQAAPLRNHLNPQPFGMTEFKK